MSHVPFNSIFYLFEIVSCHRKLSTNIGDDQRLSHHFTIMLLYHHFTIMFPTFYPQISSNLRKLSKFFPNFFSVFLSRRHLSWSWVASWQVIMCVFWCTIASIPRPWTYAPTRLGCVDFGGFRWILGKRNWLGTWEKCKVSWLLWNVDQCLSWFIMMNHIYPYHIPPWFVDSWWIVQYLPLVKNEKGVSFVLKWPACFFAVPSWGSLIVREHWRGDWQLDSGTKEFYSSKTWCFLQFLAFIPPESCFFILEHVSLAIRVF